MSELTQLRDYCEYLDEIQGEIDLIDVVPSVRPIDGFARERREPRKWLVAAAAAGLILILVGGVAWLSQRGDVRPGDEPTTTFPRETTVPTDTSVPADTSVPPTDAPTTTIEATEAVPPPGEGPTLAFVRVESPSRRGLHQHPLRGGSVWHKGALYVVGIGGQELFRSVDGASWELLPGFPPGDDRGLETDGVRLVSAGSLVPPVGSGYCIGSDAFFEINTSTNGVEWTSSKVQLPVPAGPNVAGCFAADVGAMAAGPQGIVVTGNVSLEVGGGFGSDLINPDDGTHVETTVDLDRGVIIAEFYSEPDMEPTGETVEISLDDAGFTDLITYMAADPGWEPFIEPLLQSMNVPEMSVSRDVAWFSPDGTTWQALEPGGPLQGGVWDGAGISAVVATPDGFIAASRSRLWETTDGTTWREGAFLPERDWWRLPSLAVWDGTPISFTNQGVWTIEDTAQELIPMADMDDMDYWFGDFGLVGLVPDMGGGAAPDEILFSADGTTWNRWNPTEFDPRAGRLHMVGVADDFVVLQQGGADTAFLWIGTLP